MASAASTQKSGRAMLTHLLRHDGYEPGMPADGLVGLAETRLRRLRAEADELQAALLDFLKETMKPADVTALLACSAAAPALPAAAAVAGPDIDLVDVGDEAESEQDDLPEWARLYEGDGEWHNGHRYVWPGVPAPITADLFRYTQPPTGSEVATVFVAAPLWRFTTNDRVMLRPCRWLERPQLGLFTRGSGVKQGGIVIRCRTTLTREAGGYDISVGMPRWHREYRQTRRNQKLEFYVSPDCPSIYLNCGERGVAATCGGGNNCDWGLINMKDGTARLSVVALRDLGPWEELLISYGWSGTAWATADRDTETLMYRYLCEVAGSRGYEKYPATLARAENKNPYH